MTTIAALLALLVRGWRRQPPPPQKRERERMRKRERQREREQERFIMCGERGDREFEFVFCGRPAGGLSTKGLRVWQRRYLLRSNAVYF